MLPQISNSKLFILIFILWGVACGPKVEHHWEDQEDQSDDQKISSLYEVEEVLTGDSIRLKDGRVIHYLGVESPQKGEPYYNKSLKANKWLLQPGKVKILNVKKKPDGRLMAYVYTPSLGVYCIVNKELLEYGHVRMSQDPHKDQAEYQYLQERARAEKRGIWQLKLD